MAKTETRKRGGGWNRKSVEEHLLEGTYRADRHGEVLPGVLQYTKKPPAIVRAGLRSQKKWIRNAADEYAVRNGCRFNERLAAHAADFFPKFLVQSKGEWAGEPFELLDFQRDEIILPLFGWVRKDGTRRFRQSYIELPKKQGKSTLAAGIGVYMLTADGEPGCEIYSLGADKAQAQVVHNEAVNMVEASPALAAILKVNHTTGTIAYPAMKSFYRALSATPRGKHGMNAHCAIIDELHEWYGAKLWDALRYAFRARRQPLRFVITNAGDDVESVCFKQREKAEKIIEGTAQDDSYLAIVYAVKEEEAMEEIERVKTGHKRLPIAKKCNPALGKLTKEADLHQDIRDAIQTPSELSNLLRLTYGVWSIAENPWLDMIKWKECGEEFEEADLAGLPAIGGLDLSKGGDMTSLVLLFPGQPEIGAMRMLPFFWLPEAAIAKLAHLVADLAAWARDGFLRLFKGSEVTDFPVLVEELAEILRRFNVKEVVYDAMYATETVQRLKELCPDIQFIEMPQTIMRFANPTAEYERLVISGKLRHNNHPILDWQAGHVKVLTDRNNNKRPIKPKPNDYRKVDGIVAGVMAMSRAVVEPEPEPVGVMYVEDLMAGGEGEGEGEGDAETRGHGDAETDE